MVLELRAEIELARYGHALHIQSATGSRLQASKADKELLDKLVATAIKTHSDSFGVWKDGKPLVQANTGKREYPVAMASMTKSISSIAIMMLLDDHKIKSLDEPLSDFFPEWRNIPAGSPPKISRRARITLRHVLSHTSGIETDTGDGKIPEQLNVVQYALNSDVITEPGTVWNYNNRAANLISGIVGRLTGKSLQDFLADRLFKPLDIRDYQWCTDYAGNGYVYGGLALRATDLAKIGQLLLDNGVWQSKRLLAKDTVVLFTQRSSQFLEPACALFWWIEPDELYYRVNDEQLAQWRKEGVAPEALAKFESRKNEWRTVQEIQNLIRPSFRDDAAFTSWVNQSDWTKSERWSRPDPNGFNANGSIGQYLVIAPYPRMVAVRQIRLSHHKTNADDCGDFMPLFFDLAAATLQNQRRAPSVPSQVKKTAAR